MRLYRAIIRILFAVIFIGGGISHLVLGRTSPEGYAAYARTAAIPALERLWSTFVMPNIGGLTLLLGAFEIAIGVGLALGGHRARLATIAALGFFCFILVLGYSWPTDSWWQDFLKNRAFTLVMAAAIAPVLSVGPSTVGNARPNPAE